MNSKGSGFVSIVSDPWRPVLSDGGHLGQNPGIFNRIEVDKRFDIAVFQTNIFKENERFSGTPIIRSLVTCDQSNYDICLALSIVDQNKELVSQFSTGFLRVKNSKKNSEFSHIIKMQPTNISIQKGTKLRLSISGAAWPAIGVNPGYGNENIGAPTLDNKIITLNFNLNRTSMHMVPFF